MSRTTIAIVSFFVAIELALFGFLLYTHFNQADQLSLLRTTVESIDTQNEALEKALVTLRSEGFVETNTLTSAAVALRSSIVLIASQENMSKIEQAALTGTPIAGLSNVGSGFFITNDGGIATALHVVDEITGPITIRTSTGTTASATIVHRDPARDIALLRTNATPPSVSQLGHFENIKIGETVGFIGFPISAGVYTPLLHQGVVSGLESADGRNIMLINAFVNKGNSGGPIFSPLTGRVIGIVGARQRETVDERTIELPTDFKSPIQLGNIDPLRFSVDLFNDTLTIVDDVSQAGIGIGYSTDSIRQFIQ